MSLKNLTHKQMLFQECFLMCLKNTLTVDCGIVTVQEKELHKFRLQFFLTCAEREREQVGLGLGRRVIQKMSKKHNEVYKLHKCNTNSSKTQRPPIQGVCVVGEIAVISVYLLPESSVSMCIAATLKEFLAVLLY